MVDGTHARATEQCRNGGELLDHFTDPLSFSYWMVGLGVACGRLDLSLLAVISIYASAVLTNIRAKITGEFLLHRLGPTEFKALLAGCGAALAISSHLGQPAIGTANIAKWMLLILGAALALQTVVSLISAVRAVNRDQAPADTSEWVVSGADKDASAL
jgi:phosphatidylglycerophosphate synthase